MADTQKFIDDLITFIAEAEQPKSVTNEIVARVMNFLNTGYKDLLDNRADVATEQAQRKAADKALQETIDALQTALETVSTTADAAKTAAATNKASIDTLLGDNASAAIESFNEVITFLSGVKDDASLTSLLDGMNTNISTLGYKVEDLEEASATQTASLTTIDKAVKVSTIDKIDDITSDGFYLLTAEGKNESAKLIVHEKPDPRNLGSGSLRGSVVQYLFCDEGIKMRRGSYTIKNIIDKTVKWQPWHLVDELGEQIPKEHVKVRCWWSSNNDKGISVGAKVYVDIFNTAGYPIIAFPQQVFTADNNGYIEFDVPYGFKYAIYSKYEGFSASFQRVFIAAENLREFELWNLKIGVGWLVTLYSFDDSLPMIAENYYEDVEDELVSTFEDYLLATQQQDSYMEMNDYGPVVATADTCFIIPYSTISDKLYFAASAKTNQRIPTMLDMYCRDDEHSNIVYEERLLSDFNGHLNTAKILDLYIDPKAAIWGTNPVSLFSDCFSWLPSLGQANLMQLNHKRINALIQKAEYYGNPDFEQLPEYLNGSWTKKESWWTSTFYDSHTRPMYFYQRTNSYTQSENRYAFSSLDPINPNCIVRAIGGTDFTH